MYVFYITFSVFCLHLLRIKVLHLSTVVHKTAVGVQLGLQECPLSPQVPVYYMAPLCTNYLASSEALAQQNPPKQSPTEIIYRKRQRKIDEEINKEPCS